MILAHLKFPVAVAEMHAVALAETPHFAVSALVFFHPFPVTVELESALPHIPEAVVVDVSLMVVAADAEAARDGAVGENRGDVDACAA